MAEGFSGAAEGKLKIIPEICHLLRMVITLILCKASDGFICLSNYSL